jgi:predicted phosphoribosyltransferase/dienelactone hydrolase
MRFHDRVEAGRRLAARLRERGIAPEVILGLARGGIVVAREVAEALGAELGVVVVRKIAAPWNPEATIGAVAAGVAPWIDRARMHELQVPADHVALEVERQQRECERVEREFARFGSPRIAGRSVLLVDDAICTGASALLALRRARSFDPGSIALAAPVGSLRAVDWLRKSGTTIHLLSGEAFPGLPRDLYGEFGAIQDEDVSRLLARHRDARLLGSRRLTIERDGVLLAAVMELPEGTGPFPAAILVHGSGESKESIGVLALAERLRTAGVAVLRFDLSGHGESSSCRDEPSLLACIHDLASVYAWSLGSPNLDRRRIAVFGEGLGAWMALRATLDGQIGPAALVLCAPPLQRDDLVDLATPCLLVVGDRDTNLPGAVAAAARSRGTRLELVAGADHRFVEPGTFDRAATLVTDWLAERLASRHVAAA